MAQECHAVTLQWPQGRATVMRRLSWREQSEAAEKGCSKVPAHHAWVRLVRSRLALASSEHGATWGKKVRTARAGRMAKRRSGILSDPTDGAARTFRNPKLVRSPINLPAVWLNVREYPQRNHWKEVSPVAMMESHIRDSADFLRARPE